VFVYYIVESDKSFYEACFDLPPVVQRLGFVVLHSHDLSETMRRKEIDLDDDCQTFDVCNYRLMEKLIRLDMKLSLHAPWRISVFTENGATKIGILRPLALAEAAENAALLRLAREIEEKLVQIVDEAR
jgi:uncharacterized protein (DUF302 family)